MDLLEILEVVGVCSVTLTSLGAVRKEMVLLLLLVAGTFQMGVNCLLEQDFLYIILVEKNKVVHLYQQFDTYPRVFGALDYNKNVSGIYQCKIPINSSTKMGIIYAGIYEKNKGIVLIQLSSATLLFMQVMWKYTLILPSLWTLSSLLRLLSSLSPVPPLLDLLPLSLGPETLRQCQERR